MKDALDVHRTLLAREVPHEIVRLPAVVLSADEIPGVLDLPSQRCVATRLYYADDRLVAVLVRAGELPHPSALLAALKVRTLHTAPPDVVNERTDFAASLVCPVLLPDDVPVVADACIGHADVVYTATGDSGTALGISSRWLLTTSGAAVAELCTSTTPAAPAADDVDDELRQLLRRRYEWR